jgi:hypothetical protein
MAKEIKNLRNLQEEAEQSNTENSRLRANSLRNSVFEEETLLDFTHYCCSFGDWSHF